MKQARGRGRGPPPPPLGRGRRTDIEKTKSAWLQRRLVTVIVGRGLSGQEETNFDLHTEERVVGVKDQLARQWGIPALCQKLVMNSGVNENGQDAHILRDYDVLRKYCPEQGPLRLTMVISDICAQQHLKSDNIEERLQAVGAFTQMVLGGSAEALNFLFMSLSDQEPLVRIEASRGVASAARTGNRFAITQLGACMGFDYQDELNECTAATETLAYLIKEGNEQAWAVIQQLLQDVPHMVSCEAVKVIAVAAFFYNHPLSLEEFGKCLEHADPVIQQAAVHGIALAAPQGDPRAVAALLRKLDSPNMDVRRVAVVSLGSVAAVDDACVIAVLVCLLRNQNCKAKDVALSGLAKVARPGNLEVVSAIRTLATQPQGPPLALTTLAKLSAPRDAESIASLTWRLKDANWNARGAALGALSKLASPADEQLLSALQVGMHDAHYEVRILCMHLLANCAWQGVESALPLLEEGLHDEQELARSAAKTLLDCTRSGDACAERIFQANLRRVWRQWSV